MLVQPGDPFDPDRLDRSLKTLYATGLFQDVRLIRDGDTLVVRVVENPLVNRVAFEGNHKLTDDQLRPEMQLKPRAVFTPALAEADRQRILDLYAKRGYYDARVDPQIIRLDQNRVDVVFQINDGPSTLISKIAFVGNHAFSENRLSEVINSREERWWRFLSTSDQYDPERLNFDKELLRRFYLKNGYADFEIRDAKSELSPDRKASSSHSPSAKASATASARSPSTRSCGTSTATSCAATCSSMRATGMTATRSAAAPMRWNSTSTTAAMHSST